LAPLRAGGDAWIRENSCLAIEVPSAALRMEWNVLLNPLHPAMAAITIEVPQPFHFDRRMFRGSRAGGEVNSPEAVVSESAPLNLSRSGIMRMEAV
jgi:hypothetical protein